MIDGVTDGVFVECVVSIVAVNVDVFKGGIVGDIMVSLVGVVHISDHSDGVVIGHLIKALAELPLSNRWIICWIICW